MDRRKMRKVAEQLVRSFANKAEPGVGITVIVHSDKPHRGEWPMALDTTLPNRRHYRALFSEAIAASVIADGGDMATAGDIAADDYEYVVGKVRPS